MMYMYTCICVAGTAGRGAVNLEGLISHFSNAQLNSPRRVSSNLVQSHNEWGLPLPKERH